MLPGLLLLLSPLAGTASARCSLAALETVVHAGPDQDLLRTDRWTWRVEAGLPDCAQVHLASPSTAPLLGVEVELLPAEGRPPRLRGARRTHVADSQDPGFGPSAGVVVHTPEVRDGDLLVVSTERRWPREEGGFTWRPGVRGPLEVATLAVPADLPVRAEGLGLPPPAEGAVVRAWEVEDVPAGGIEPHADGPARPSGAAAVHRVEALLLPQRRPVRGLSDPEVGRTLVAEVHDGALPGRVLAPPEALARWCFVGAERQACPPLGDLGWTLPAQGQAAWGWVQPGAAPSGDAVLAGPAPRSTSRFTLVAPTGRLALHRVEGGLEHALLPLAATPGGLRGLLGLRPDQALPEGLAALLDASLPLVATATAAAGDVPAATAEGLPWPRVGWRLLALGDEPLLPDAHAAQQAVAWLAIRASLPEPALPVELKGRKADASAVPELLAFFHGTLHPGALPGQAPLLPRKLMRVRRSGWGSPWELALVLTRYLQQLKLDALPLPVRPVELGPGDPASLSDWPLAVVRVRLGDQTAWLDPTCPTCGLQSLRPTYDGATVLSPELDRLPALPASSWRREVAPGPDGLRVAVAVEGPLAVELRARVAAVRAESRGSWLAERFAGPGARLHAHRGLVEGDGPLELDILAPADAILPPPLAAPAAHGEPLVALPAAGRWSERRRLPAGAAAAPRQATRWLGAEADGLVWRRTVTRDGEQLILEEQLDLGRRVVDRAPAAALLGRLSQAWGRLSPPPPPPLPAPPGESDPPAGSPSPAPGPPSEP